MKTLIVNLVLLIKSYSDVQVFRRTSRRSSTGSTWLSLWFSKPSRVLSTTRSPTSRWRSPSMAGQALARTLWPGSLQITCIVTGWRASVSDCSSPRFTSRTPDWWTRTRWDIRSPPGTECDVLCQTFAGSVLRNLICCVRCLVCVLQFSVWMIIVWTDALDQTSVLQALIFLAFSNPAFVQPDQRCQRSHVYTRFYTITA